jgi:hypothetical protein
MISDRRSFRMDFFYHYSSITTKVSVEIVDDDEPNPLFFDHVDIGSEDLKRLFPGPLSDLAVSITPDPMHPAFPPHGLTCWVAPHDNKVRKETPPLLLHDLAQYCSMDVPCVSLLRHHNILNGHRS